MLPNMNLPYLLVITTYPGASPEQVESDVTQPLENSLSTLNGVKNVTSQSNENYTIQGGKAVFQRLGHIAFHLFREMCIRDSSVPANGR